MNAGPHYHYLKPPTPELLAYAAKLISRLDEGCIPQRAKVALKDWIPQRHMCHDNARIWSDNNAEYDVVQGWLHFPLPDASWSRFVAHSVVRHIDGHLIDISPSVVPPLYPFIASGLSVQEFRAVERQLIASFGAANLDFWHGD